MKNKVLEELTQRSQHAVDHLPRMLLRGDGVLVDENDGSVYSNAEIHQRVYAALQEMLVIRNTLRDYPRNRPRTKGTEQEPE